MEKLAACCEIQWTWSVSKWGILKQIPSQVSYLDIHFQKKSECFFLICQISELNCWQIDLLLKKNSDESAKLSGVKLVAPEHSDVFPNVFFFVFRWNLEPALFYRNWTWIFTLRCGRMWCISFQEETAFRAAFKRFPVPDLGLLDSCYGRTPSHLNTLTVFHVFHLSTSQSYSCQQWNIVLCTGHAPSNLVFGF